MARKMGEEPSTQEQTPGTDSEAEGNVTEATFLEACAEIAEQNRLVKAANERRKVVRKKWKANGVTLGALDSTLKMADWDRDEVRDHFATRRKYATWMGLPIAKDGELFEGMSETEVQKEEWKQKGLTHGLLDRKPEAPEECPANMHQSFMEGYHLGQERRAGSGARGAKKPSTKAPAKPAAGKKPPAKKAAKGAAPKGGYRDTAAKQDAAAAAAGEGGDAAAPAEETKH